jgi:hypothetical protein
MMKRAQVAGGIKIMAMISKKFLATFVAVCAHQPVPWKRNLGKETNAEPPGRGNVSEKRIATFI